MTTPVKSDKTYKFPKHFLWGASTASHQVEGNNINDWSEWEKSKPRLDDLQKRGLIEKYGLENYISGSSCEHYKRYESDFKLAKKLNHSATRISIEWSRIEPEEGKFDEKEINHYKNVVKSIRENGMEPFVTIWHWPIPLWMRDKGGWESSQMSKYFTRYAEKICSALKDDVKFWITLNEPEIYSGNSYQQGVWPPQKKNLLSYLMVFHNLINCHKKTYKILKKVNKKFRIGIAKNNSWFEAVNNNPWNRLLKFLVDWWWNFYFLDSIKNHQDFIGLNHYFHNRIDGWFNKNLNEYTSDMGWELLPNAIYHVLKELKRYKKPIYITENGLADTKDEKRTWFIKDTLVNVSKAIKEGVDVRGYLHWSLMDNFEWDSGYWPRFGLIEIDQKTKSRTVRNSAKFYAEICKNNEVSESLYKKFEKL